jgi:asparagine synthase (glutamine-hydrolysing)
MTVEKSTSVPLDVQTTESMVVRKLLRASVQRETVDALLLSGGIDSSMLAALDARPVAITVGLENCGSDIERAQEVTQFLGMRWHPIELSRKEAMEKVREIMWHTKSYDPAVLNDIPTFTGMQHAKKYLGNRIRNGEFADTLFNGYSYLKDVSDIRGYIRTLVPNVILSTSRTSLALGMHTHQPYFDSALIEYLDGVDPRENIAYVKTETAGDFVDGLKKAATTGSAQRWTKILLRRSALGLLPIDIAYRPRNDLEFGSGMSDLEEEFSSQISDGDFKLLQKEKRFWNKMHARFYAIFKEMNLEIQEPQNNNEYPCTWCNGGVTKGRCHCLTCGAYKSNE